MRCSCFVEVTRNVSTVISGKFIVHYNDEATAGKYEGVGRRFVIVKIHKMTGALRKAINSVSKAVSPLPMNFNPVNINSECTYVETPVYLKIVVCRNGDVILRRRMLFFSFMSSVLRMEQGLWEHRFHFPGSDVLRIFPFSNFSLKHSLRALPDIMIKPSSAHTNTVQLCGNSSSKNPRLEPAIANQVQVRSQTPAQPIRQWGYTPSNETTMPRAARFRMAVHITLPQSRVLARNSKCTHGATYITPRALVGMELSARTGGATYPALQECRRVCPEHKLARVPPVCVVAQGVHVLVISWVLSVQLHLGLAHRWGNPRKAVVVSPSTKRSCMFVFADINIAEGMWVVYLTRLQTHFPTTVIGKAFQTLDNIRYAATGLTNSEIQTKIIRSSLYRILRDTNKDHTFIVIYRKRPLASRNSAGRCRWSAGFLGDIPFPPPLHSGAAPVSPYFTLIASLDLVVKSRPNLLATSYHPPPPPTTPPLLPQVYSHPLHVKYSIDITSLAKLCGIPQNASTRPQNGVTGHQHAGHRSPISVKGGSNPANKGVLRGTLQSDKGCAHIKGNRRLIFVVARGGRAASLLASHQGEPGSNPRLGHSGFSQVGIVPNDAVGSAGFLGDLPPPPPNHSDTAPYSLQSPSSALKTSLLRAAEVSSLTYFSSCVLVHSVTALQLEWRNLDWISIAYNDYERSIQKRRTTTCSSFPPPPPVVIAGIGDPIKIRIQFHHTVSIKLQKQRNRTKPLPASGKGEGRLPPLVARKDLCRSPPARSSIFLSDVFWRKESLMAPISDICTGVSSWNRLVMAHGDVRAFVSTTRHVLLVGVGESPAGILEVVGIGDGSGVLLTPLPPPPLLVIPPTTTHTQCGQHLVAKHYTRPRKTTIHQNPQNYEKLLSIILCITIPTLRPICMHVVYSSALCKVNIAMGLIWNYFPSIVTNITGLMSSSAPVKIYAGGGRDIFRNVDFKSAHFIVKNRDTRSYDSYRLHCWLAPCKKISVPINIDVTFATRYTVRRVHFRN
ncbi:hypothetical protein PR048_033334 [Dryococelus australis]|uniref:Uncharacterized protein n=1 Tax=Dryococelus australis TaxID=614101 RepID=A0ABQ9G337_9NEOP|nr:hypothetical protein PR048_033334 [Dryococelus australis]